MFNKALLGNGFGELKLQIMCFREMLMLPIKKRSFCLLTRMNLGGGWGLVGPMRYHLLYGMVLFEME